MIRIGRYQIGAGIAAAKPLEKVLFSNEEIWPDNYAILTFDRDKSASIAGNVYSFQKNIPLRVNVDLTRNLYNFCFAKSGLVAADISHLHMRQSSTLVYMFGFCEQLKSVFFGLQDSSRIFNMEKMFYGCVGIESLDLSSLDVSGSHWFSEMFYMCHNLRELNLKGWNPVMSENFRCMFFECKSLESLDVKDWDTSAVNNFYEAFSSCLSLKELDLSNWKISNAKTVGDMFGGCVSLRRLDIRNFVAPEWLPDSDVSNFLYGCTSLEKVICISGMRDWLILKADIVSLPEHMRDKNWFGWEIV